MLDLLSKDVRIINIDQTWINDTMFIRRRWRRRGAINTMNEHKVTPRTAVMMAISTKGELYCSLT